MSNLRNSSSRRHHRRRRLFSFMSALQQQQQPPQHLRHQNFDGRWKLRISSNPTVGCCYENGSVVVCRRWSPPVPKCSWGCGTLGFYFASSHYWAGGYTVLVAFINHRHVYHYTFCSADRRSYSAVEQAKKSGRVVVAGLVRSDEYLEWRRQLFRPFRSRSKRRPLRCAINRLAIALTRALTAELKSKWFL